MSRESEDAVYRLAEAIRSGEAVMVQRVLSTEAAAVCDSAGLIPALTGSFHGARDVAGLVALLRSVFPHTDLAVTVESVNGRPGLLMRRAAGEAVAVIAVDTDESGIKALWIVLNQEKLGRWHRVPKHFV